LLIFGSLGAAALVLGIATAVAGTRNATVSIKNVGGAGKVLVDTKGRALYMNDEEHGRMVLCTGACLLFWTPLTVSGTPKGTSLPGKLTVVKRPDGGRQVAYKGRLLYSFTLDKPGKVTGDGFKDAFGGQKFTGSCSRLAPPPGRRQPPGPVGIRDEDQRIRWRVPRAAQRLSALKGGAMRVEDVMTTDVVTAPPDAPLKVVAEQLSEQGISGLPVVNDDGEVLGVISEADLLVKEAGSTPRRTGLLGWLLDPADPREQLRLEARVAGEAMSKPAITIAPYASTAAAAGKMLEQGINRLPVVRNERLVGIVTRADLVRAFARPDDEVVREVRKQVEYLLALADDYSQVDVCLRGGDVWLTGRVRRRSSAEELPDQLARIPGVVGVVSKLTWLEDDAMKQPRRRPLVHS
jgi:CBS domain-containing protein/predicted lipoprotein with Yx(FWY)xxD motif